MSKREARTISITFIYPQTGERFTAPYLVKIWPMPLEGWIIHPVHGRLIFENNQDMFGNQISLIHHPGVFLKYELGPLWSEDRRSE